MDLLDRISVESLHQALKGGDLVLTEEGANGTTGIIGINLVNAPPERVWEVVTDYGGYADYVPLITKSKVVSQEENRTVVEFVAGMKVKLFSLSGHVTFELIHTPFEYIAYRRIGGKVQMMEGYWRLLPVANGQQSIMACKVTADLTEINRAVRYLLERVPAMVGPLLHGAIGVVGTAVRKKAEGD